MPTSYLIEGGLVLTPLEGNTVVKHIFICSSKVGVFLQHSLTLWGASGNWLKVILPPPSSSLVLVPAFCPLDQPNPRPPGGQPAGALTTPPRRVSARWTPSEIPRHQRTPPEKKGGKWLVFMIAWLLASTVCEETYLLLLRSGWSGW